MKGAWTRVSTVFLLCAAGVTAQTFTVLDSFDLANGALPQTAMLQGLDGNFYGTTSAGGINASHGGTIFKMTPAGTLTVIYNFCTNISNNVCIDGENPGPLVLAADGNFYGTTYWGGTISCEPDPGCGTIFKITPSGTLTTLYTFCPPTVGCPDGAHPYAALIQAPDGEFYGTTHSSGVGGGGTFFKMTLGGTLTTLYSFCSQIGCADGSGPAGTMVQAPDGNFYGTTVAGGTGDLTGGTVFKITPDGSLTTLYNFCSQSNCLDGSEPFAGLVQGVNGEFFGTTSLYGPMDSGTVFKITPGGALTTVYAFCSQSDCMDGAEPLALIRSAHGDIYGITSRGGFSSFCPPFGCGTVFQVTAAGKLATLHRFCAQQGCIGGMNPQGGLLQATTGEIYGTAFNGGASNACPKGCGTTFSLSMGLAPFIETVPISGHVGTTVRILGINLASAMSITFNGIASAFTIVSSSEITTTVPTGATTGKVEVVTPNGTLSSNVHFRVLP